MSPSSSRYLTPNVKPIIHTRASSTDSRTSSDSRSSADYDHYTTSTTRSNMSDSAYRENRLEKRRVPDNESRYVTTTTSRSGSNQVHDHRARGYDPQEPRASEARYEDYKRTKEYPRSQYYSSGSSSGSR